MFILDTYNINTLDDVVFNKKIYNNLIIGFDYQNRYHTNAELDDIQENNKIHLINYKPKIYNLYNILPNLLIHGQAGSGKKTLIHLLLNDIFDESINDIFNETYFIKGYGNAVVEVILEQSKYHLIFEPNNSGLDKYIILEIIKDYATKKIINDNFPFRVVLIKNVDNLNYNAQSSLRTIIEKYHKTCRFILCCNQITKIIDSIKSRCFEVRIRLQSKDELINYIYNILIRENRLLSHKKIINIVNMGELNIKKTLWLIQIALYNIKNLNLSWEDTINSLIHIMCTFKNTKNIINKSIILTTRQILYNIFTTNITSISILNHIINKIIDCNQFDINVIYQILQIASEIDNRLIYGKRSTIHLDYFLCSIYGCIYNYYYNNINENKKPDLLLHV